MKDVLSLATFAIGVLCFVVFVTTVKPDAISAVPASSKLEYCKMQASGCVNRRGVPTPIGEPSY